MINCVGLMQKNMKVYNKRREKIKAKSQFSAIKIPNMQWMKNKNKGKDKYTGERILKKLILWFP
jgi:hypothetical protein